MHKTADIFMSLLRKAGWYRCVVYVLTIMLLCSLLGISFYLERQKQSLPDQMAAKRWSEQEDYAQLSFFFSGRMAVFENEIKSARHQLENALKEAGEQPKNSLARLYVDTYASFGKLSIQGEQKSIEADAIGVGGDFFLFHPLELLSGGYFSESEIRKDVILIDEDVAWQLFGSSDIVGKDVRINGAFYRVAGVFRRPTGTVEQMAGSSGPMVCLPYESFVRNVSDAPITVYEVLLPNPVKGFALQITEQVFTYEEKDMITVENSNRFSYEAFYKLLQTRQLRSMKVDDIVLPFWENVARVREEGLAEVALLQVCIASILAFYWIAAVIVFLVKHKPTKEGLEDLAERVQGWFQRLFANQRGKVKKEEKNE